MQYAAAADAAVGATSSQTSIIFDKCLRYTRLIHPRHRRIVATLSLPVPQCRKIGASAAACARGLLGREAVRKERVEGGREVEGESSAIEPKSHVLWHARVI